MAKEFKRVDRDQLMLVPPDMREWLPTDHLVWLVLEVVDQLDLSGLVSGYRRGGVGREAYDPGMLTAVLVYAYCAGERSSRRIEQLCGTDVAFRVAAAQHRPDHTTLARFRARHAEALAGLFGQVLVMCASAGMGRVGSVAIDGTKIAGQASLRKNYSEARLRKLADQVLAEAAAADAAEDAELGAASGAELPAELAPGPGRAARIKAALAKIAKERQQAVDEDVATAERVLARAERSLARERHVVDTERAARPARRRGPVEDRAKVRAGQARVDKVKDQVAQSRAGTGPRAQRFKGSANTSDPETGPMLQRGKGFVQGFNAQVAVTDDHLILATDVTNQPNDAPSFVPMMNATVAAVAGCWPGQPVGVVLADAGYISTDNLTAPGPDRLIATGRTPEEPAKKGLHHEAITTMAARLQPGTPDRERYKRRQATVEPVLGQIKDRIGLRRFSRRGLQAARHELALAALAFNIRRLATTTG